MTDTATSSRASALRGTTAVGRTGSSDSGSMIVTAGT